MLFSLALIPVILLLVLIYFKDKNEKEPIGFLLLLFFAGMGSILPALIVEAVGEWIVTLFFSGIPVLKAYIIATMIVGPIEELKHQDYHGKRVRLRITDSAGGSMETKLDLGVHNKLPLEQEELWFDTALQDEGIALMANSKEQVCAEKLRSLMRIGVASTRFKDVFDVYYLLCREGVDAEALDQAMHVLVYDAADMRERSPRDARDRLSRILNDRRFRRNLSNARNNWLGANVDKVVSGILRHFG